MTIRIVLRHTFLSAHWGASCPRQGRLLPPTHFWIDNPDLHSGLYSADFRRKRKEGFYDAAIRREEARAAAAQIGASYQCAEFRDLEVFSDNDSRKRVMEILRRVRPDVVLTSAPVDYLCDHEATSLLVRDACFGAPAPNYLTDAEEPAAPLDAIPHLYFMDAVGGVDRDGHAVMPDFVVDVSSTFARKREMLAAHASQRQWLQSQHGMDDYLLTMENWTRVCGKRAAVEFGEGFRRYKGHPYPESELLRELLVGVVHVV